MTLVDIYNRAFIALGQHPIVDENDTSRRSLLIASAYPTIYKEFLGLRNWTFSRKRSTLNPMTSSPREGYDAYTLPSDFINVIEANGTDAKYEIEGSILYINASSLILVYNSSSTDINRISPLGIKVLALLLAEALCDTLTQSTEKERKIMTKRQMALADASHSDSSNDFEIEIDDIEAIDVRY